MKILRTPEEYAEEMEQKKFLKKAIPVYEKDIVLEKCKTCPTCGTSRRHIPLIRKGVCGTEKRISQSAFQRVCYVTIYTCMVCHTKWKSDEYGAGIVEYKHKEDK